MWESNVRDLPPDWIVVVHTWCRNLGGEDFLTDLTGLLRSWLVFRGLVLVLQLMPTTVELSRKKCICGGHKASATKILHKAEVLLADSAPDTARVAQVKLRLQEKLSILKQLDRDPRPCGRRSCGRGNWTSRLLQGRCVCCYDKAGPVFISKQPSSLPRSSHSRFHNSGLHSQSRQ